MSLTDKAGASSPDPRGARRGDATGCIDGQPIELPSGAFDEFVGMLGEPPTPVFEKFRSGSTRWDDAGRPDVRVCGHRVSPPGLSASSEASAGRA